LGDAPQAVKDKRFPLGVRPFTICEYARLQGFPDDDYFPVYLFS
jgi:DNA (cytosine-5)-methyltransferase 1